MVHSRLPFALLAAVALCVVPARAQDAGTDAGVADGGPADAGVMNDAGPVDAGPDDAGVIDAGLGDAGGGDDAGLVDDAGAADAGSDADAGMTDGGAGATDAGGCAETCAGDALTFCDGATGEVQTIDCASFDARCGELSAQWGLDCLLPAGAECAPGYAGGLSRCDPDDAPFCNTYVEIRDLEDAPDGGTYEVVVSRCESAERDPEVPGLPANAAGFRDSGEEPGPLAFLGCDNAGIPGLNFLALAGLFGLRRLRRRLRER